PKYHIPVTPTNPLYTILITLSLLDALQILDVTQLRQRQQRLPAWLSEKHQHRKRTRLNYSHG
ncbi:hypothetical protein MMB09_24445, partial [Salmonella enterica]|nr:hypothetical protein [Salmonella enterica]